MKKLAVLLGDPVSHSKSPAMLNAAFHAKRVDAVYVAWRVPTPALKAAISTLAVTGALGANVTVPHKETAAALVDVLSPAAAILECINCITFKDGVAEGHNTDVPGLARALREQRLASLRTRPAIILGAGGAARASVAALASLGFAELHVVNRSAQRRRAFRAFAERYGAPVDLHAWSALAVLANDAGLVINATSAQVKHEALALPRFGKHAVVYDLTYGKTPLVTKGIAKFEGSAMLLHQAAAAFELWTGAKAPLAVMRRALG